MNEFELLPIRCMTCSHVLGHLDAKRERLIKEKMPMSQIFEELNIPKVQKVVGVQTNRIRQQKRNLLTSQESTKKAD